MIDADINIGDVFLFKTYADNKEILQKGIIIKVDSEDWFHACVFLENSDKEAFNTKAVGDMLRKHIEEVVDHWDAERVMRAARAGGEITGFQWSEEEFARIRKEMKKPSYKEKL